MAWARAPKPPHGLSGQPAADGHEKLALGPLEAEAKRLQGDGRTVVHVAQAGRVIGLVAIADAIRPTSKAAVAKLRERKIEVVMLTGDNLATATRIAADLGIDKVLADVLPGQKAEKVKALQASGKKVGMVGDGVNDAPALTQANVVFAISAGTDVAMESADVVLMKSDPYDIVGAIELSRATVRKMHQNLWWAGRLQHDCVSARCRRVVPVRVEPGGGRDLDVRQHAHRRDQCADVEAHQVGGYSSAGQDGSGGQAQRPGNRAARQNPCANRDPAIQVREGRLRPSDQPPAPR